MNAASYTAEGSLAPGAIISVFGSNLANTTASAPDPSKPPTSLGGVTLTISGVPSPLFFVSPTQINAQIDERVPPGNAAVVLTSPTGTFTTNIAVQGSAAPGIFSLTGSGVRDGAVLNALTFRPGPFSVTTDGSPTYLAIFVTGLDLSAAPVVTIGGMPATVQFYGNAPGFPGLQQINVQVPAALAGAGRVELVVTSKGNKSNVVEVVILPSRGQGRSWRENEPRSREISSLAYVPGTSLALVADENDDVVRVVDVGQKKVTRIVTLPEGAEPVAVAANATLAVVAERNRGKAAVIDLATYLVKAELPVARGPVSVAIAGTMAVVVNQESDSVTLLDLAALQPLVTLPVGHAPRAVAVDAAANRAYVTNQADGTVSVIDLAAKSVLNSLSLGADSRPAGIALVPSLGLAVITEPSAGPQGKVVVLNLATGATVALSTNPDRTGGSSAIAVNGTTVYFANQTAGSVTIAQLSVANGQPAFTSTTVKTDLGTCALAVDTKDNLLLILNQGSGNMVLIDLASNQVVGRIDALRSGDDDEDDDHQDRDRGRNIPVIASLSPASAKAGVTFALTVNGSNLTGATSLTFTEPVPGFRSRGKGNDPARGRDAGFTVTNIVVNSAGTQLTAQIQIAAGTAAGPRIVRVLSPNGESVVAPSPANTFTILP